ncbi:MAG TPA: GNAT family N-acetyltransferase [Gaiellaceae bacterium]|nr:GNAT family N-acetyltransferase [Gaiellaceae bacterium]
MSDTHRGPAVTVRPLRDDEFEPWLQAAQAGYEESMRVHGGVGAEAARRRAAADVEALFPDRKPSEEQLVYALEADGERVGDLWVAERDAEDARMLFVFAVEVDDRYRGRGYGRAAMEFAEEEAERRGLEGVALNVFGGNEVARGLYRSLGYAEVGVYMRKRLGDAA